MQVNNLDKKKYLLMDSETGNIDILFKSILYMSKYKNFYEVLK